MIRVVLESYLLFIRMEWYITFRGLGALERLVRNCHFENNGAEDRSSEQIARAVDLACVFYPKRVLCLQRAAATVLILRRRGYNASLVLGAQMIPFSSHAWVELDGMVFGDKPYVTESFRVLDRI